MSSAQCHMWFYWTAQIQNILIIGESSVGQKHRGAFAVCLGVQISFPGFMLAALIHWGYQEFLRHISNASKLHGLFLSIKYLLLEDTQRWRGKNTGNPIQLPVSGLGNSGIPLMRFWDFLKNTYGIHFPGMCCELLSHPSILFCQVLFHLPAYLLTLSQNSPEQTLL